MPAVAGARPVAISQPADQADRALCAGRRTGHDARACSRSKLQERVGQTVVVENRAGGNGGVAAGVITAAPADGYTLLVVDTTLLSVSPLFVSQLSYNPQKDFVPIAALARTPLFLAVNADTPIKTLAEFIDYAKAQSRPAQLRLGGDRQHASPHHGGDEVGAAISTSPTCHIAGPARRCRRCSAITCRCCGRPIPISRPASKAARSGCWPTTGSAVRRCCRSLPPLADIIPGFDLVSVIGVYGRAGMPEPIVRKIAAEAQRHHERIPK